MSFVSLTGRGNRYIYTFSSSVDLADVSGSRKFPGKKRKQADISLPINLPRSRAQYDPLYLDEKKADDLSLPLTPIRSEQKAQSRERSLA